MHFLEQIANFPVILCMLKGFLKSCLLWGVGGGCVVYDW